MNKPVRPSNDEMNQLFVEASENHQNGLLDAARSGYMRLLGYFPEAPLLHSHLGLVYYEQGAFECGRDCFEKAANLSPEDMDILFNLALCQRRTGDLPGAIDSYKRILEIESSSIDTLYNLAGCYKDTGQLEQAVETYLKVLQLDPEHLSANSNLAFVYHKVGETGQAVHYYQKVLEYRPDHQSAQHMLAALTGSGATSSPESYVKGVFDNYSEYYEQSLVVELEYCVPMTIRKILDTGSEWKKQYNNGLDLGCGTGLGAEAISDMVDTFDGIDLSEKMIALASDKGLYRNLFAGNIASILRSETESYDFFLAADVFAYVGDLHEIFSLLKERARIDALFCCSTESMKGSDYKLQRTGRFAHSPAYVKEVARVTDWKLVERQRSALRKEKGVWVQGDLWFFRL